MNGHGSAGKWRRDVQVDPREGRAPKGKSQDLWRTAQRKMRCARGWARGAVRKARLRGTQPLRRSAPCVCRAAVLPSLAATSREAGATLGSRHIARRRLRHRLRCVQFARSAGWRRGDRSWLRGSNTGCAQGRHCTASQWDSVRSGCCGCPGRSRSECSHGRSGSAI